MQCFIVPIVSLQISVCACAHTEWTNKKVDDDIVEILYLIVNFINSINYVTKPLAYYLSSLVKKILLQNIQVA